MTPPSDTGAPIPGSQTLSRGLSALELLADSTTPLTIAELAEGLGVHRSNAYRILRTLEEHRFVVRDDAGRIRLGPKITALSHGVAPALHTASAPVVTALAHELAMTAFFTVLDGDEVVTLATTEPSNAVATIARNPGVRHTVHRGAPGHAIESSLTPTERRTLLGSDEFSEAALTAKRTGHAISSGEVLEGVSSVAVPLRIAGEPPAAIAMVHFTLPEPHDHIIDALQRAAAEIARNYG